MPASHESGRVYGRSVQLDYSATQRFFDARAARASTSHEEVTILVHAEARDLVEREKAIPWLALEHDSTVLDVGCGAGRWAWHLCDRVGHYHGTDFSPQMIELARTEARRRGVAHVCTFQVMSAAMLTLGSLDVRGPYDVVMSCGMLMYLNDTDCAHFVRQVPDLVKATGLFYVTEPIGTPDRLTLVDHFSDELQTEYSAVYRTQSEYEALFAEILGPAGFEEIISEDLYPPELSPRTETKQYAWVYSR